MANWKYQIDLKDLHEKYDNNELTSSEVGKEVAKLIRESPAYKNNSETDFLEELADQFENVEDEDDYNNILSDFYDWGDSFFNHFKNEKMCWINTL